MTPFYGVSKQVLCPSRTTIGGAVSPVGGSARSRDREILSAMAIARDVAIPVVDPYGSVFRLLRSVELPFSLFRVEDPSEIEADAPFAILSSYGKPDAGAVGELALRVPTVVYAVQVRASEPAPLMRALAYVSDRMPTGLVRDVILGAVWGRGGR
jgi:hypothetical protein